MKKFCVVVSIILIIVSGFFFYQGFDKKDNYYSSESYSSLNENAYVGGDAYNYIINANYFTGYIVIGSAAFISSCIFLSISFVLNKMEGNNQTTNYISDRLLSEVSKLSEKSIV